MSNIGILGPGEFLELPGTPRPTTFFMVVSIWMMPHHYMKNGWKSPSPSIYKWLETGFQEVIISEGVSGSQPKPSFGDKKLGSIGPHPSYTSYTGIFPTKPRHP